LPVVAVVVLVVLVKDLVEVVLVVIELEQLQSEHILYQQPFKLVLVDNVAIHLVLQLVLEHHHILEHQ
tara:strand:+ start:663 stop:866 length:204 start_codon:yes stop_codon:yes gene_type:complete